MNIMGLDFETTGIDPLKDRPVEYAFVAWDVENRRPLGLENGFCFTAGMPAISKEAAAVHGLHGSFIEKAGIPHSRMLDRFWEMMQTYNVQYVVAHNGRAFDFPMLNAECERQGFRQLDKCYWLDTMTDIPYPSKVSTRKLTYLATEHGLFNPFPHRAFSDVLTMLQVLGKYPFSIVLEERAMPMKVVQARVSYDDREKAKSFGFKWQDLGSYGQYPKKWIKAVKARDYEALRSSVDFPIVELREIKVEL